MKLNEKSNAIHWMIDTLVDDIREFVRKAGGFIDTQNADGERDGIYGINYDYCDEDVHEVRISALRVTEDGSLEVLPCDKNSRERLTREQMEATDDWHVLIGDDTLYKAETALAIAEYLEEYLDAEQKD